MNRLKELRQEKGLSQQALGKEFGVSYRTIQNWENGVNSIKQDKAQQLADYFDVSVAYLLGYSEYESEFEIWRNLKKENPEDWANSVKARIISLVGEDRLQQLENKYVDFDGESAEYGSYIQYLAAVNSLSRTEEEKLLIYFGLLTDVRDRKMILDLASHLAGFDDTQSKN